VTGTGHALRPFSILLATFYPTSVAIFQLPLPTASRLSHHVTQLHARAIRPRIE
jgi:hypothetical protein